MYWCYAESVYDVVTHVIHYCLLFVLSFFFFFQAEDGIRVLVRSRGLGDVYKRQIDTGLKTGQLDGDPFTPENALEIIREGQNSGIYDLSLIHI